MKKGLAVFDFDGTITSKDSFLEFIKYTHSSFKLYLFLFLISPLIVLYFLKLYPNQKLKTIIFSFFYKGKSEKALLKKGMEFTSYLNSFCFPEALQIIQQHKNNTLW